jgi:hypothetical protein
MGLVSAASNPAEIFCARIRPALEQADFEKNDRSQIKTRSTFYSRS